MENTTRRDPNAPFIVSVGLVKNEQDIIESSVRHNLQFVDAMVIVDNLSSDRTRDILVALQREGLPVVIGDDPDPAHDQSGKMTRIVRAAIQSLAPDYLCLLDADEFLAAPSRAAFEASLSRIPRGGQGLVAWSHYVLSPTPSAAPDHDPLRAIRHRLKREAAEWFKAILSVPGMDMDRIVIEHGNHAAALRDGGFPPAVRLGDVRLAHLPVRSAEQITAKIIVGRMAYFALFPQLDRLDTGFHWDLIYRRIMSGEGIDRREASRIALNYAQDLGGLSWEEATVEDPLPCSHTLRHTAQGAGSALVAVARSWERHLRRPPTFTDTLTALAETKAVPAGALDADLPPFRFLIEKHRPASVLDVGCGAGIVPLHARSLGVERVLGIDDAISAASVLLDGADFRRHDLSAPFDLGVRFDLVTCLETAGRLTPGAEDTLLASLARHARERILFSGPEPGQPGAGGVAHPVADWLAKWDRLGWVPDGFETLAFRTLASQGRLRRNALVLVRKDGVAAQAAAANAARLVRHAQRPWRWWNQPAQVIEHPFVETAPPLHGPLDIETARALLQRRQAAQAAVAAPAAIVYQPGDSWCRVVMNDAVRRLVEGLDTRSMVALEISGTRWSAWPFAKRFAAGHPRYDVGAAVVSWAGAGRDGRFDIVLAEQALEHAAHPRQAVRNMHTMLKEGGHLLIAAPFPPDGLPEAHNRWSEPRLRALLVENGFPAGGIVTGSWGNRACAAAGADGWAAFDPQRHSLANEPDVPLAVWALARKDAGG